MKHLDHLTPIQWRVWELLGTEGLSDTEIALRLKKSPHTIRSHMRQITAKLGVPTRSQAIVAWWERALDMGREQCSKEPTRSDTTR